MREVVEDKDCGRTERLDGQPNEKLRAATLMMKIWIRRGMRRSGMQYDTHG